MFNSRLFAYAFFSFIAFTLISTSVAEPPQVRKPSSGGPSSGVTSRGNRGAAWPKVRTPGTQSQAGQRAVYAKEKARIYIDPNALPPNRNWYLGVSVTRAPKGVRVSRVVSYSPAGNYGLEAGDYILDIGGYVVGEHNGSYYPLSMAMEFGADANGWAEILVWNRRTYREETMWIQFVRR